jgi:DNA-binding NarL/FixJ family response regulator
MCPSAPGLRCVLAAVEAGAVGVLRDTADAPTVRDAVAIARRGGRLEFPDADPQPAPDGFGLLTAREREVLAGLLDGLRPSDIAERHFVSVTTVRNQVQSILTKLNVSSQLEAVAAAHRTGWSLDAA